MENVNSFQVYLKQIRKHPLLTAEEEKELTKQYRAGDTKAKDKLITSNLRLVIAAAKHYSANASMSFDDLVQEGNLGLIRATEDYNPDFGWRFSTYAMHWIKQAISRAIMSKSRIIRIPVHIAEAKVKYKKAKNALLFELNREPTEQEIADKMQISVKRVKEIEEIIKDPISLNTALNDEDEDTIEDLVADTSILPPEEGLSNRMLAEEIKNVLSTLEEREQKVIISRFGLDGGNPQTLDQIGERLKITKERVRQIENKALNKLRNPLRAEKLKSYCSF